MNTKAIILEVKNEKGDIVAFFKRNDNDGKVALYSCQLVSFDDIGDCFEVSPKSFTIKGEKQNEEVIIDEQVYDRENLQNRPAQA